MTQFSSLYGARLDEEIGTDDSTTLFTTARRKSAINRGQEEFAAITECLTRLSTITITGGTAEYNLASTTILRNGDFLRRAARGLVFRYTDASSNVTILAGTDLIYRDVSWLDQYEPGWQNDTNASTTQQLPTYYYLRPDGGAMQLGFSPTPCTGSSATAVAQLSYLARPTPLTSDTQEPFTLGNASDPSDLPQAQPHLRPYHQALVHYAAHQLEKLRRDTDASDRQLQKFMGYVQRYWQDMRTKGGTTLTFARRYFARPGAQGEVRDPRT